MYKPESFIENVKFKIIWDFKVEMDYQIPVLFSFIKYDLRNSVNETKHTSL